MHEEPKSLLAQAIQTCLPILEPLIGQSVTQYQVWKKTGGSQWHGEFETRPDLRHALSAADGAIDDASRAFGESFLRRHPEYNGMVGFGGSRHNWARSQSQIVRGALLALWRRHKSFDLEPIHVDAVVQEFADFVTNETVRLRFQAQLINFKMPVDSFTLPEAITIRKLSEEEVSEYHGGHIESLGFVRPQSSGIHEFILEGELDEPKAFGESRPDEMTMSDRAKRLLDRAILCLRTFKEGPVGYDYVHFKPVKFCPFGMFSVGCGDKYVPFGSYSLAEQDFEQLSSHASQIFAISDNAMEMACSRLADAENRSTPHDRIVDSVIGMESLLLAGLGKDDRRGELSFRFSLNFAMLFDTLEERQHAYRLARDLYGLRSVIAHGSSLDEGKIKLSGQQVKLPEAAKRATSALRKIIMHFLPKHGAPYKRPEFWQRAYFGFPEAEDD